MKFPAFEPIDLKNKFGLSDIPLDQVFADPNQPRKNFSQDALLELSESIKKYGVFQPIIVRKNSENKYQIIAGERRWRASHLAGVKTIPAVVKEDSDRDDSAIALVENIQREALNPIEMAQAFSKLSDEHQLSHDEIAKIVGKSRAAVSNTLRLLNLADAVKSYLVNGQLEMGHARPLLMLSIDDQVIFSKKIIENNLSVRDAERLVKTLKKSSDRNSSYVNPFEERVKKLEKALLDVLGCDVSLKVDSNGKSKATLSFRSLDEIEKFVLQMSELSV